jgi:hypothetical protein
VALLTQIAGTWAAGTEAAPPAGAGTNPRVSLGSVSCASAGNCTTVGGYVDGSGNLQGLLLTQTAATWAAGVQAAPPAGAGTSPQVSLGSVSCTSAGNCTTVGSYADGSGNLQGLLLTQTTGTWAAGVQAPLPADAASNPFAFPASLSCASAGNRTAVGQYTDSSGSTQGLLLTQTTPTCSGSGLTIAKKAPSQTGTPGTSGSWSFTITAQNCTGGDLHAKKIQGGTAGWLSNATATTARPRDGQHQARQWEPDGHLDRLHTRQRRQRLDHCDRIGYRAQGRHLRILAADLRLLVGNRPGRKQHRGQLRAQHPWHHPGHLLASDVRWHGPVRSSAAPSATGCHGSLK